MSYYPGHQTRYNSYSHYIKTIFVETVRKLSVDAGFTCPNRDGTKGRGGCTYCINESFTPRYCGPGKSITDQLQEGIDFFSASKNHGKYLAYFQAFSNTYAPVEKLKRLYYEALRNPDIAGIVIATRPDCIDAKKLDFLENLSQKYFVALEFGVESCSETTLARINRCHTFEETRQAILLSAGRNIHIGTHLILGLPGEDDNIMLSHAEKLSDLPIDSLKLHQLQILKNTKMAKEFRSHPLDFPEFTVDEYINLVVRFLEKLNPLISVERFVSQSPQDMLISPVWGMKNFEFAAKVGQKLEEMDTWQGRLFEREHNRINT